MADLVFTRTSRGFAVARFQDRYGADCSLQKSSLADQDAIWLGAGGDRMHLTQEMVRALLPALQHFADHGELPCDSDETEAIGTGSPVPRPAPPRRMDELGLDTGLVDRMGDPVHLGDTLEFDAAEWGEDQTNRFVVAFAQGELTLRGSVGDVSEWCTVVKKWSASS